MYYKGMRLAVSPGATRQSGCAQCEIQPSNTRVILECFKTEAARQPLKVSRAANSGQCVCRYLLEKQLQRELNASLPPSSKHGIAESNIRCGREREETNTPTGYGIDASWELATSVGRGIRKKCHGERISEVRMIRQIEKVSAELKFEALSEARHL